MSDNPFSYDSESSESTAPSQVNPYSQGESRGESPMVNPYAPTTDVSEIFGGNDDEQMRRQYLSHEASVRSLGVLYLIPAVLLLVLAIGMAVFGVISLFTGRFDEDVIPLVGVGVGYGLLGALYFYTGLGLRRLSKPARVIASIFSALGLLAIPFGTLISAYFLYLLLSQKGKVVFSTEYKRVIEKTPHIKYKTSLLTKIVLGIFLFLILALIIAAVTGA